MNRMDLCGIWNFRSEDGVWRQGTVPEYVYSS